MTKTDKIETTPRIKRLNAAIATFDAATRFSHDTADIQTILAVCDERGWAGLKQSIIENLQETTK